MPTQRSPIYLNAAQKVSAISVFPPALQSICLNDPVVSTSLSIGCTLPRPGSETHLQLAFPEHSVQLWKTCACVQLMMSVNPEAQPPACPQSFCFSAASHSLLASGYAPHLYCCPIQLCPPAFNIGVCIHVHLCSYAADLGEQLDFHDWMADE